MCVCVRERESACVRVRAHTHAHTHSHAPPPQQIKDLTERKRQLSNRVSEMQHQVEVIEKRASEQRALDEAKRKEEVEFLRYQGTHFQQFITTLTGGSGK